jgi:hypothetical protein
MPQNHRPPERWGTVMNDETERQALRNEIERLLAAALNKDANHDAEMHRRDEVHIAETERRDKLHHAEMQRRDELHVAELGRRDQLHMDEMALFAAALESRDTIGQAKGVIMVTMRCTADEAFRLLKEQSQHQNRKLVEVAAEIAERAQRYAPHRPD